MNQFYYRGQFSSSAKYKMELLATMVNSRKMLTTVAKNTTLDVTGLLWTGGLRVIFGMLIGYIFGGRIVRGCLYTRGILTGFYGIFILNQNFFFFKDSSIKIDMVVCLKSRYLTL